MVQQPGDLLFFTETPMSNSCPRSMQAPHTRRRGKYRRPRGTRCSSRGTYRRCWRWRNAPRSATTPPSTTTPTGALTNLGSQRSSAIYCAHWRCAPRCATTPPSAVTPTGAAPSNHIIVLMDHHSYLCWSLEAFPATPALAALPVPVCLYMALAPGRLAYFVRLCDAVQVSCSFCELCSRLLHSTTTGSSGGNPPTSRDSVEAFMSFS